VIPQFQVSCRLAAQGEFRSVYAVDPRIAAWRGISGGDASSWEESKLHQAQGLVLGQIETIEDTVLAPAELGKRGCARRFSVSLTFDTQLHYGFSMK
jgi:hypothetical protein